ncbi:hypothetical protein BX264_3393 [Streptomyces sp. 2333.5]|uniref:hypothetical protein n=1 Tax=Streptomyces TaxID=1883 RepID=UPI000899AF3F|nr:MULTISPECIES: hypothetical protein [unclassified Streptomyces]PJJ03025.1 hypothetical protein BX264_3393 [Streptomyces sp. 2333.5]SED62000.1 hypothetical protein SAMN05428943_4018 [Streptomyces sp. 2314.4]SEE26797.1 hypothetical protein SAMN05428942_3495 [Streptomyces sp. 2112.2]
MGEPSTALSWSRGVFGELAAPLARLIPECIVRAHERARDGHRGVGTQTLEAYGHGLHASQYEELAAGLTDLPGATAVRLQARTVMVVAGHVLYPIRYAKRDVPVTVASLRRAVGLRADLIRRHGPEPMQGELDLGLEELQEQEFHKDLEQLDPEAGLVLLAYACSMSDGVMRLEWGDAELRQGDRHLLWHHHEPLDLPDARRSA